LLISQPRLDHNTLSEQSSTLSLHKQYVAIVFARASCLTATEPFSALSAQTKLLGNDLRFDSAPEHQQARRSRVRVTMPVIDQLLLQRHFLDLAQFYDKLHPYPSVKNVPGQRNSNRFARNTYSFVIFNLSAKRGR
jgi:hypothetical protein